MTLVLAIKVPSRQLNPKRRPLRFEPGIVVAVDTRFTYPQTPGSFRDDAQKLWPIGHHSFATYAGEVELAERAILLTQAACMEHNKLNDSKYTRSALKTLLRHISGSRGFGSTVIIYGARTNDGRFLLHRLSSDDNFEPRQRDGFIVEGSGAAFAAPHVLGAEIEALTLGWSQPAKSGYKIETHGKALFIEKRGPADLENVSLISISALVAPASWIARFGRALSQALADD
jgi:hypothetical protein